jgi:hypothetical protein
MLDPLIRPIRKFTDQALAGSFKTTADGRRLFYPWGIFSRGYVIDAGEQERLANQFALFAAGLVVLLIIGLPLWGLSGDLVVVVFACGGYAAYTRSLASRLTPSDEPYSATDAYRSVAQKLGPKGLRNAMIAGAGLIALGLLAMPAGPDQLVLGLIMVLLGGAALGLGFYLRKLV